MSPAAETPPTDEHCYSTSNNTPSNAPVKLYIADDPETLPGPEIEPEHMVIKLIEEELPAIVETNQVFEVPEELPVANIQQPVQMLPLLFPNPPLLRHPNPLNKIHQHPFRMLQDPLHHPLSRVHFSNGTLEDPTNGPIRMRDITRCVLIVSCGFVDSSCICVANG
jgi:hypothetical protein